MEYLVPLLILLVVVIVVVVGAGIMGRRNRSTADAVQEAGSTPKSRRRGRRREISREDAEEASARLTPETHQLVYSYIAQRQVLNAVKEYRKATHLGLGDSAAAVAALAQFPQPTPEAAQPTGGEKMLTVEDIINATPEAGGEVPEVVQKPAAVTNAYRYRAIVSQGEEIREVASTRLNEDIFRRIRELALSGDYESAARMLREHADIGVAEAKEFVSMIGPEN
ncbi:hypothetical protein [Arthrobacter sp. E3]|uniref:hypothetical protein n=1 Tax=Arthrobacter sp. E3 TaxID=517402 RepID=UPI001A9438A5|nr:hypothetical protein [Arthrobacter sp. E3]